MNSDQLVSNHNEVANNHGSHVHLNNVEKMVVNNEVNCVKIDIEDIQEEVDFWNS